MLPEFGEPVVNADLDPNLANLKQVTADNDTIADRRPAFYHRIISG
jgi:hypothetical protein